MLLDTGAAVSLISTEHFRLAKRLGAVLEKIPCPTARLKNASNGNMANQGLFKIAFFYNNRFHHGKFFLCPELRDHSIIGMNIIQKPLIQKDLFHDFVSDKDSIDVAMVNTSSVESIDTEKKSWTVVAARKCVIQPRTAALVKCAIKDQHNNFLKKKVEVMAVFPIISVLTRTDENGHFFVHIPNNDASEEVTIERADKLGTAESPDEYETTENHEIAAARIMRQTDQLLTPEHQTVEELNKQRSKKHSAEDLDKVESALADNIMKNVAPAHQQDYYCALKPLAQSFSSGPMDLGRSNLIEHEIHLEDNRPIYTQQFRLPIEQLQYIKEHVASWLRAGLIERARSPYNSPIFCVPKKNKDEAGQNLVRTVLDYRHVNFRTLPDRYSIRTVEQCIDEVGLAGSKIFSCLDLTNGFWQMLLREEDRPITAFTIPGAGQFQWCVCSMGLTGAPASFSRLIDLILRDASNCITFIDDVLVHSNNHQEHLSHLTNAITKLSKAGLKLNPSKCIFGSTEVQYLGHTLTSNGVQPGKDKSAAIASCEPPASGKQLKSFLGLANYFRGYIKNFAKIAAPLFKLTRTASDWKKGPLPDDATEAFKTIRARIASRPLLKFVNPTGKFSLFTDACLGDEHNEGGLGAVLMQEQPNGANCPIGFASRRLTQHEKNYPIFVAEMQAAIFGMEFFEAYLKGRHFYLFVDHQPLVRLSNNHTKTLNRLQLKMNEMFPDIRYVDAANNTVADFLSRYQGMTVSKVDASPFRLQYLQNEDTNLTPIFNHLSNSQNPSKPQKIKGLRHSYFLMDGTLMISPPNRRGFIRGRAKVVAPTGMHNEIILEAHNSLIGGHAGMFKTAERIREEFWWPNMEADINDHIKACQSCQSSNNRYKTRSAPLQPLPDTAKPNERIHIDLFGGLKNSIKKNNFVLVMTDSFSKLAKVVAIPNKAAPTVARAFLESWIWLHGVPRVVVSDQGNEWCNEFTRVLWDLLGIEHKTTTPYMPSTNSAAETFNKTMANFLRTAIKDSSKSTLDWELYLGPLMFSYNSAVHKSTKVSPFYTTFGYDPRYPLWDSTMDDKVGIGLKNGSFADHLAQHHHTLATTRKIVSQNNQAAKEAYKTAHDNANDTEIPKFQPGDLVWVKISQKNVPNPKLASSWEKGTIVSRSSLTTFVVRRDQRSRNKLQTLNANKLRPRAKEDELVTDDDEDEDEDDDIQEAEAMEDEINIVEELFHQSNQGSLSFEQLLEYMAAGWTLMGSMGSTTGMNNIQVANPPQPQQPQQQNPAQAVIPDPPALPNHPTVSPSAWQLAETRARKQLEKMQKRMKKASKVKAATRRMTDFLSPGSHDKAPEPTPNPDDNRPPAARTRSRNRYDIGPSSSSLSRK